MFRSEKMKYFSVLFPRDNAYTILDKIGDLGIVDFEDQNDNLIFSQ